MKLKEEVTTEIKTDLTSIAGGEMPSVKQNAIDAVQNQKAETLETAIKIDGFDPHIHATDADGNPQYTKSGNLKKKRGRKKASGSRPQSNSSLNLGIEPEKEIPKESESMGTAVTVSGLLEVAQIKMISEEFKYNEIEREVNIKAWCETFDHYGGVDLSPPQKLAMSHAQIILARALSGGEKSETRAKFKMAGIWLKQKVSKLSIKRKNKDGALSDSGENSKRKNNASDENGEGKTAQRD